MKTRLSLIRTKLVCLCRQKVKAAASHPVLPYAKVSSEPQAAIKQYRIPFNRNTMVVDKQFIRDGDCDNLPRAGQDVLPHSAA